VRLNAIDSGFHVVLAGPGHADPGAGGDSVNRVPVPDLRHQIGDHQADR
jgi:hypothetical protein